MYSMTFKQLMEPQGSAFFFRKTFKSRTASLRAVELPNWNPFEVFADFCRGWRCNGKPVFNSNVRDENLLQFVLEFVSRFYYEAIFCSNLCWEA